MARLYYTDLLALIAANLPDNTTELITPAKVREVFDGVMNCFAPAGGGIYSTAGGVQSVTTTDAKLVQFTGDLPIIGDPTYIVPSVANDEVTTTLIGVHQISVTFDAEGGNNDDVIATVYRNGVATAVAAEVSLRGNNNKVSLTFGYPVQSNAPGPNVFDVRVRTRTGTTSVTFTNLVLALIYLPGQ